MDMSMAAANRRKYLGGTDISAIIGVNPYRTAFQVWLEKTGQAEPFEGNEATRWGTILEDPIAQEFSRRHSVPIIPGRFVSLANEPFLAGHPDRLIRSATCEAGLEVKTAGIRSAHRWGDPATGEDGRVPDEYLCQCLWYCAITGLPTWWLAVLIGGQDYRDYELQADPDVQGTLLEAGRKFWHDHVLGGRPPAIDASDAAADYLRKRFPREKSAARVATLDEIRVLEQYRAILAEVEELETERQVCENRIKELIGETGGLVCDFGKVTWTANKDSRKTDWQAVARALNPAADLVEQNTKTVPGARVLRKAWKDTTKGE